MICDLDFTKVDEFRTNVPTKLQKRCVLPPAAGVGACDDLFGLLPVLNCRPKGVAGRGKGKGKIQYVGACGSRAETRVWWMVRPSVVVVGWAGPARQQLTWLRWRGGAFTLGTTIVLPSRHDVYRDVELVNE